MRYELRELKWQERCANREVNYADYFYWKVNMNAPTKQILTVRKENGKYITWLMEKYRGGNCRIRMALRCFMKGWY